VPEADVRVVGSPCLLVVLNRPGQRSGDELAFGLFIAAKEPTLKTGGEVSGTVTLACSSPSSRSRSQASQRHRTRSQRAMTAEFPRSEATEQKIMESATGG